jgi:hypothetical protein
VMRINPGLLLGVFACAILPTRANHAKRQRRRNSPAALRSSPRRNRAN